MNNLESDYNPLNGEAPPCRENILKENCLYAMIHAKYNESNVKSRKKLTVSTQHKADDKPAAPTTTSTVGTFFDSVASKFNAIVPLNDFIEFTKNVFVFVCVYKSDAGANQLSLSRLGKRIEGFSPAIGRCAQT